MQRWFYFFFLISMSLLSFSCLIDQAKTWSIMLIWSGESRHPWLVAHLRGKTFSLITAHDVLCEFFIHGCFFFYVEQVSVSNALIVFILKRCWTLSNAFSSSTDIMFFFPLSFCWYSILHLLICVCWIIFCIPGISSTWSWDMSLLMCYSIWFASIFLRIFTSIFTSILAHSFLFL